MNSTDLAFTPALEQAKLIRAKIFVRKVESVFVDAISFLPQWGLSPSYDETTCDRSQNHH